MKTQRIHEWIGILAIVCWTMGSGTASGQTFSSGSTGADGAYAPTCAPTPCTVTQALPPSGVYNYTTVTIPSGVTVRYTRNAANTPVTLLAAGDVTIMGTISVNGDNGLDGSNTGQVVNPGGFGGPGGFNGGNGNVNGVNVNLGGTFLGSNAGQGPGGGNLTDTSFGIVATQATYGAANTFVSLLPLFGGSGGFGNFINLSSGVGGSGGGGGGAIVIASSSKISVTGSITANGGAGGNPNSGGNCTSGGSGGAIRLVAPEVSGAGSLQAIGINSGICSGNVGGPGKIRLEAFNLGFPFITGFTGTANPLASQTNTPGPVTTAGTPSLVDLPTLRIGSVGGFAAPAVPGGSYATADISLPPSTSNLVAVMVSATNTPVGAPTAITVRVIPQTGNVTKTSIPAASHTGTFASSTASADVNFPVGEVSVVQAWATMTLTGQIASLMPLIDSEPVERVQVAAAQGERSTLSLVTKSGKEVRVDRLAVEDQLRVARAWEVLRATRLE